MPRQDLTGADRAEQPAGSRTAGRQRANLRSAPSEEASRFEFEVLPGLFTGCGRPLHSAGQRLPKNRELGIIQSIDEVGRLCLRMDGGRAVELDPHKCQHLDHGYAMTSHSSQGQTADRVLIHVDTELGANDLLNSRMAYVSVSRGRYDAQIYTNNAQTLGQQLSRDVSHSPAIQQEPGAHKIEPRTTHTNQISQGFGLGL